MTPTTPLTVRRAGPGDYRAVAELITESAGWMHGQGWDAWPPSGFGPERIMPGIDAGEVWLLIDIDWPVATMTLDQKPEAEFKAPEAEAAGVTRLLPRAYIGHKLAATRRHGLGKGYGSLLVRWSLDWAARQGAEWRLTNVARRATPLQEWYAEHGFEHLATVTSTCTPQGQPRKSGYLMGRRAERDTELEKLLRELD